MLSIVTALGSKKVLNKTKDPKKDQKKLSAAESTALGEELNRVVLRLYGQFLSEVRERDLRLLIQFTGWKARQVHRTWPQRSLQAVPREG